MWTVQGLRQYLIEQEADLASRVNSHVSTIVVIHLACTNIHTLNMLSAIDQAILVHSIRNDISMSHSP